LRIGFISIVGSEIALDIVRQSRELNPEVEFFLRNILTAEQVQMLETGSLDIGFLRLPIGGHSALDVLTVHREPFVLVVHPSHKLAKRKKVRLRDVADQDFVMYERAYTPGLRDLIVGMLRDARIVPNVSQTGADLSTVISLVNAHMGIAIAPLSAVKQSVAPVVACDIVDRISMSEIGMAVRKGIRAPVVDNFRSFALTKLGRAGNSFYANRS
jgi:DNA-binding transcriptional LysR family regulator